MNKVVYVTGNAHKARYFSELVGHHIEHRLADVPEIQSLDLEEVVTAKAKAAYEVLRCPVIVEDTSLVIEATGHLPGTFIKWFLEEMGPEGLCRLADSDPSRKTFASACFAYYDGRTLELFKGGLGGSVPKEPKGSSGFGWNAVFIPKGEEHTLGEMDEENFRKHYKQIKPFDAVKEFLDKL